VHARQRDDGDLQRAAIDVRHLARAHRYQRLEALASGGMGTVYLGRIMGRGPSRTVAMKVLHPHLASDPEMVAMFLDEARVATRLRHPNLVGVLDMDMIGDELVIVMDYVEGTTLGSMQSALRQRGKKMPVGVGARILCDALAGLHDVHELRDEKGALLGLVHRDFSPHNLLVGTDGTTRLTDFGVALAAGRLASTRPDGTLKGKLRYLAPEQVGRKPVDRRVDVFAAGIVLWECITGERLFEAPTEAETVTRVLRHSIEPPSTMRPEISIDLDEVCLRALERDPERRFQNAADFGDAVRSAGAPLAAASDVGRLVQDLAAESISKQRESLARARSAPRTTAAPAVPSPGERHPRLGAVLFAGMVVGGAVAALAFTSKRHEAAHADSAVVATTAIAASASPAVSSPVEPSPLPRDPEPATFAKERATAPRGTVNRAPPVKHTAKPPKPYMPDDL
jgi:serine/threonine protein kinase